MASLRTTVSGEWVEEVPIYELGTNQINLSSFSSTDDSKGSEEAKNNSAEAGEVSPPEPKELTLDEYKAQKAANRAKVPLSLFGDAPAAAAAAPAAAANASAAAPAESAEDVHASQRAGRQKQIFDVNFHFGGENRRRQRRNEGEGEGGRREGGGERREGGGGRREGGGDRREGGGERRGPRGDGGERREREEGGQQRERRPFNKVSGGNTFIH